MLIISGWNYSKQFKLLGCSKNAKTLKLLKFLAFIDSELKAGLGVHWSLYVLKSLGGLSVKILGNLYFQTFETGYTYGSKIKKNK